MDRANSLSSDVFICSFTSHGSCAVPKDTGPGARRAATPWGELRSLFAMAFPLILQNTFG